MPCFVSSIAAERRALRAAEAEARRKRRAERDKKFNEMYKDIDVSVHEAEAAENHAIESAKRAAIKHKLTKNRTLELQEQAAKIKKQLEEASDLADAAIHGVHKAKPEEVGVLLRPEPEKELLKEHKVVRGETLTDQIDFEHEDMGDADDDGDIVEVDSEASTPRKGGD